MSIGKNSYNHHLASSYYKYVYYVVICPNNIKYCDKTFKEERIILIKFLYFSRCPNKKKKNPFFILLF